MTTSEPFIEALAWIYYCLTSHDLMKEIRKGRRKIEIAPVTCDNCGGEGK